MSFFLSLIPGSGILRLPLASFPACRMSTRQTCFTRRRGHCLTKKWRVSYHRRSYPTKGRASTRTRNTISTHHSIISQCWHNGPPYSATTPEPLLPVNARPLPSTTTPEPLAQPLSIPFFYLTRSHTKSLVLVGQISVLRDTSIASIARVGVPVQLLRCWGYLLPALRSPRVQHVLRHRS